MADYLTPVWIVVGLTLGLPVLLIAMFALVTTIGTICFALARLWKRIRGRRGEG